MINLVFFQLNQYLKLLFSINLVEKAFKYWISRKYCFVFICFLLTELYKNGKCFWRGLTRKLWRGEGGNQVLPCNYFLIKGWRVVNYCTTREHYKTCTFKRPSIRLFRFKIYKFDPFCMKTPKNPPKRDKLINFKSK